MSEKDRKRDKDSRSDGDISRHGSNEMSEGEEEDESEIICTQTKSSIINARNKRVKKATAKLEKEIKGFVQKPEDISV
jgi:hypothetical protein